MLNRHFLIKFWKCQKAVSILPHEAKALMELFCLQLIVFGLRQNSFSSSFASWGKIKRGKIKHDFTLVDQDCFGPMIFKNFADQHWIGFNIIGSGLDSDWKISQSAHLCNTEHIRDDHHPVCRLDIRQDSEFATGYGYPKTPLKREPDTDPDIRNAFIDISRIQTFGKSCTLHNHSFIDYLQKHLFSLLCHDSKSVCGVLSVP